MDTFHAVMGLVAYFQNSDSLKTESLFSSILLNTITELEKQLSQKDTLITFLSQQLIEKSRGNQEIVDERSNCSYHKRNYNLLLSLL